MPEGTAAKGRRRRKPTVRDAVNRSILLYSVVRKGYALLAMRDEEARNPGVRNIELSKAFREDDSFLRSFTAGELSFHLSNVELRLAKSSPEQRWDDRVPGDVLSAATALLALLWALRKNVRLEFPALRVSILTIARTICTEKPSSFRPSDDIGRMRHLSSLWEARVSLEDMLRTPDGRRKQREILQFVRELAELGHEEGFIPRPVNLDVPYGKTYFRNIRRERLNALRAKARAVGQTMRWLQGLSRTGAYRDVPCPYDFLYSGHTVILKTRAGDAVFHGNQPERK